MATESHEWSGTLDANEDTEIVTGRGPCMFVFNGTFDSGTVTLYHWIGGAFVPITDDTTDKTYTADGSTLVSFPHGIVSKVKATMAGAGGSVDVDYRIAFDRPS